MKSRGLTGIAVVIAAAGLVVGLSLRTGPGTAGADGAMSSTTLLSTSSASTVPSGAFYLAVGASSSLGYQPMGIVGGRERATKRGYANDLVRIEAEKGVSLSLRQIGCAGETAASILTAVDHCFPSTGGQLRQATQFLQSRHDATGLVTVDLGFNDVRACLTRPTLDVTCANNGVAAVRATMPRVLGILQSAAGPHAHFVGLLADDPFLAHYLRDASGRANAAATLEVMGRLNAVLRGDYVAAKIPVADVAFTFQSSDQAMVSLAGVGSVPTNVAVICHLTWMCNTAPWGPDDHPNDAGYLAIAHAIDQALATVKW